MALNCPGPESGSTAFQNFPEDNQSIPWIFLFIILALFFSGYYYANFPVNRGELVDPDCYMRLNRVQDLHDSGKWYDAAMPRSNAPYGETLHWTRPLDVILLAGAWVCTPFVAFKPALFWWGVMVSPVIFVLSLLGLIWAVKPLVSQPGRAYLGLLFLTQPILLMYCPAARPDHHSLLILCFIVALGFAVKLLQPSFHLGSGYAAGAILALAMWISVESLVVVFIIALALGLLWLWRDDDFPRRNLHFWLGLTLVSASALLIEHPYQEFFRIYYDSLSIVHVGTFGIIALYWLLYVKLANYFKSRRAYLHIPLLLAGLILLPLVVHLFFPKFFSGPFADVDPRIKSIWLDRVAEIQPLWPSKADWLVSLGWFLGPALVAVPAAFYFFWQDRRRWLLIIIGLGVFIPLTVYQNRWGTYAAVVMLIPLAELLSRALRREAAWIAAPWRVLARSLTVVSFCLGFLILPLILSRFNVANNPAKTKQRISPTPICRYLEEDCRWRQEKKRILTYIDFGPEILYRTHHKVIGTPYIRNSCGIWDSYRILTTATDTEAHALILARGINLILLCPSYPEAVFYASKDQGSAFQQRLIHGKSPPWLRPISLPPDLAKSFQLFEVIG